VLPRRRGCECCLGRPPPKLARGSGEEGGEAVGAHGAAGGGGGGSGRGRGRGRGRGGGGGEGGRGRGGEGGGGGEGGSEGEERRRTRRRRRATWARRCSPVRRNRPELRLWFGRGGRDRLLLQRLLLGMVGATRSRLFPRRRPPLRRGGGGGSGSGCTAVPRSLREGGAPRDGLGAPDARGPLSAHSFVGSDTSTAARGRAAQQEALALLGLMKI